MSWADFGDWDTFDDLKTTNSTQRIGALFFAARERASFFGSEYMPDFGYPWLVPTETVMNYVYNTITDLFDYFVTLPPDGMTAAPFFTHLDLTTAVISTITPIRLPVPPRIYGHDLRFIYQCYQLLNMMIYLPGSITANQFDHHRVNADISVTNNYDFDPPNVLYVGTTLSQPTSPTVISTTTPPTYNYVRSQSNYIQTLIDVESDFPDKNYYFNGYITYGTRVTTPDWSKVVPSTAVVSAKFIPYVAEYDVPLSEEPIDIDSSFHPQTITGNYFAGEEYEPDYYLDRLTQSLTVTDQLGVVLDMPEGTIVISVKNQFFVCKPSFKYHSPA